MLLAHDYTSASGCGSIQRRAGGVLPAVRLAAKRAVLATAIVLAATGTGTGTGAGTGSPEGVRAFCLQADEVTADAPTGTLRAPFRLRCARAASLQFAYTASRPRYLMVIGRAVDGSVRWYLPRPGEAGPALLAPAVDEAVGPSFRLGINHAPGAVDVLALFSDRPLDPRAVAAALSVSLDGTATMADNVQRLQLEVPP